MQPTSEFARELNTRDRGAALLAVAKLGVVVMIAVPGVMGRVQGGFDKCPAQVSRSILRQRASLVATA
jgi:hypothetical protein